MNHNNPNDMEQARCLVRAVFEELGIDMSTAETRIEAQRDFAFLRDLRTTVGFSRRAVLKGVLAVVIPTFLVVVWLGFRSLFPAP
jgi:hypothetical protein